MADHTPTPWTSKLRESQVIIHGPGKIQIVATSWHSSIRSSYPLKQESLANAAFIVKAANAHEDLVKALTDTLCELTACANQLADRGVFIHEGNSVSRAQIAARRVLASIKEAV